MTKTKHSRKHIVEALRWWTRELKKLDESSMRRPRRCMMSEALSPELVNTPEDEYVIQARAIIKSAYDSEDLDVWKFEKDPAIINSGNVCKDCIGNSHAAKLMTHVFEANKGRYTFAYPFYNVLKLLSIAAMAGDTFPDSIEKFRRTARELMSSTLFHLDLQACKTPASRRPQASARAAVDAKASVDARAAMELEIQFSAGSIKEKLVVPVKDFIAVGRTYEELAEVIHRETGWERDGTIWYDYYTSQGEQHFDCRINEIQKVAAFLKHIHQMYKNDYFTVRVLDGGTKTFVRMTMRFTK